MTILVSIDNGGTLTDVCATGPHGVTHVKTLTTPHDLTECFVRGLEALSDAFYGETDFERLIDEIDYIRYSTTQGTNAIVQRKGPRLGVLTNDAGVISAARDRAPELFDAFVGDRIAQRDVSDSEALIKSVSDLVSAGANRIVVAMAGDDAHELENAARRTLYTAFPRHLLGAVPLLFSAELSPLTAADRRIWGAILNAFLHPAMEQFLYNAEKKLREAKARHPLLIFRNDGNATRVAKTVALKTYSSGPQGGVVGCEALLDHYGIKNAVSIDIGGTTTDIAAFADGRASVDEAGEIEGAPAPIALTKVESVGVGGGSIIRAENGAVAVGPESVGAAPGPACFGRGGSKATITDALLCEGLLDPDSYFGGQLKLDRARAEAAIMAEVGTPLGLDLQGAIDAMIDAYDNKIAQTVKDRLSGDDVLVAFGGAGPMSVCGVAEKAGLKNVLIPRFAAVFSAYGILFSDIEHAYILNGAGKTVDEVRAALMEQARRGMLAEGFELDGCELSYTRLVNNGNEVTRSALNGEFNDGDWLELQVKKEIDKIALPSADLPDGEPAMANGTRPGRNDLPVYRLEDLAAGAHGAGPCIVEEAFFTVRVRDGWRFKVSAGGDLFLTHKS